MLIEGCIHILDFSIKAYQNLIDRHVSDGQVVGPGVRGEWSANTPLNEVYQSHIDAFKMAKDIVRKYQKIQEIIKNADNSSTIKSSLVFYKIKEVVEDDN